MQAKYNPEELRYGILFFIFHICIEVVCYTLLYIRFSNVVAISICILYDFFAFVPQSLIGAYYRRLGNIGYVGIMLFAISILLIQSNDIFYFVSILLLAVGNAMLHECGAIAVASVTKSNIFPSALFVAGGSLGIVIGKWMGKNKFSLLYLLIPIIILSAIVFTTSKRWNTDKGFDYKFNIDIIKKNVDLRYIIIVAFLLIAVRSYIGFIIPMQWKKNLYLETVLLFCFMGIGKALGGYLCDTKGYRFVSIISTLGAIPFIIIGQWNMYFSLIGILIFSMTMSVGYAMLLSVINKPGIAFGITTIALFVGAMPTIFLQMSPLTNVLIVTILSKRM